MWRKRTSLRMAKRRRRGGGKSRKTRLIHLGIWIQATSNNSSIGCISSRWWTHNNKWPIISKKQPCTNTSTVAWTPTTPTNNNKSKDPWMPSSIKKCSGKTSLRITTHSSTISWKSCWYSWTSMCSCCIRCCYMIRVQSLFMRKSVMIVENSRRNRMMIVYLYLRRMLRRWIWRVIWPWNTVLIAYSMIVL